MWKRDKNNNGEGDGGFNNLSSTPILISLICPMWFPIIHHYLCEFQFLSYNMNIKRHVWLFILFFELLTYVYMTTWNHKLWTNPNNNHQHMSIYWFFCQLELTSIGKNCHAFWKRSFNTWKTLVKVFHMNGYNFQLYASSFALIINSIESIPRSIV